MPTTEFRILSGEVVKFRCGEQIITITSDRSVTIKLAGKFRRIGDKKFPRPVKMVFKATL